MSRKIAFLHSTLAQEDGWRQVLPAGHFRAHDGRPFEPSLKKGWFMDKPVADRLIKQVKAKGKVMVDYEHAYLFAALNAQQGKAPETVIASGWIHGDDIKWQDDGLWVKPRWTQRAKEMIDAEELTGLSATFTYDDKTGEPVHFLNVALTNDPALTELKGLTNLAALSKLAALSNLPPDVPTGENSMNELLLQLLAALGIEATEETIAEDVNAGVEKINSLIAKEATADEAIADLKAKAVDPLKFVPREALDEARAKIAALSGQASASQVDLIIEKGRKSGRVMKSEIGNLKHIAATKGIAVLSTVINARAPIAALSDESQIDEDVVGAAADAVEKTLTEVEKEAAESLGISVEEYLKMKLEQEI